MASRNNPAEPPSSASRHAHHPSTSFATSNPSAITATATTSPSHSTLSGRKHVSTRPAWARFDPPSPPLQPTQSSVAATPAASRIGAPPAHDARPRAAPSPDDGAARDASSPNVTVTLSPQRGGTSSSETPSGAGSGEQQGADARGERGVPGAEASEPPPRAPRGKGSDSTVDSHASPRSPTALTIAIPAPAATIDTTAATATATATATSAAPQPPPLARVDSYTRHQPKTPGWQSPWRPSSILEARDLADDAIDIGGYVFSRNGGSVLPSSRGGGGGGGVGARRDSSVSDTSATDSNGGGGIGRGWRRRRFLGGRQGDDGQEHGKASKASPFSTLRGAAAAGAFDEKGRPLGSGAEGGGTAHRRGARGRRNHRLGARGDRVSGAWSTDGGGGGGVDVSGRGDASGAAGPSGHGHGQSPIWWFRSPEFQSFLLHNPFVPLLFRFINLAFTAATLGVAVKLHTILKSEGATAAVGASPVMGVVIACLTLVHVGSQIWLEYGSRPIGLWAVSSKLAYTLVDVIAVSLWSALLSLSFDNYFTSSITCTTYNLAFLQAQGCQSVGGSLLSNPQRKGIICRLQGTLIGLTFVSLLAYVVVFTVSLFRIFERVSQRR